MAAAPLYEISNELLELEDLLEENEGVIEGALERIFDVEEARDEKVDGYCALIQTLESRAKVRRGEARRLTELARVDENKASRLKSFLLHIFQRHDWKRVDGPRFRATRCRNGGKQPLSVDTNVDLDAIPERFVDVEVVRRINSDAIREALEAGEELDFAELGERGEHIRIK